MELQARMDEIINAHETLEDERAFAIFSKSDEAVFVTRGRVYTSLEDGLARVKGSHNTLKGLDIAIHEQKINVLSTRLACAWAAGDVTWIPKEGNTYGSPFALTTVWIKNNGRWWLIQRHQSFPS